MPNRLAAETSPYLLQHAENPVDWFPWGDEALARARAEDKPIFLSIGYSACHWCHVMEHESFENEQIAEVLNREFVCIKVDREERPDLDQIYMMAVQVMTGRGGWPMSVFLTPDLHPFFGGTYWPASPRMGMPGFGQVIAAVIDAWQNRRGEAVTKSQELTNRIQQLGQPPQGSGDVPGPELLLKAAAQLQRQFDFQHGGFGTAPKFPHAIDLQLLLRIWRRTGQESFLKMVCLNLDMMARGGIYDHLAGGFARYAVDERWLVPHFEKMLYDNALLSSIYLDAFVATREPSYADVACATVDYVLAYMTDELGGFYSTEDADSEGEEGKFYVWTPAEIKETLGDEFGARFCYCYDVTPSGNFEGKNILNLPKTLSQIANLKGWDEKELVRDLADARNRLREVRDRRVRPGKDDKVLVSWNGLMIDAVARAGSILGKPRYLQAATAAAGFIEGHLRREDGRLLHSWRRGQARFDAYLDDYACFANALVTLYEATFDERWVDVAVELVNTMLSHFKDPAGEGFFYTADDHEPLIARQRDLYDSSVPSGSAMAATVLTRLGKLCGRADFLMAARGTLELGAAVMEQSPTAAGQMLVVLDMIQGPLWEIAVIGDPETEPTREVLQELRRRYLPNKVVACRKSAGQENGSIYLDPIFLGRHVEGDSPAAFVCEKFVCEAPVRGEEAILQKWHELEQQPRP